MVRVRTFFICLLLLPAMAVAENDKPTPDEYWQQIRKIAAGEFSGIDLNPVLTTRYQFEGDYSGWGVGMNMDLPLWNKKRQQEKREKAVKFLQAGATLVQKLETTINTLKLLKEKSRFLKAIMRDEGVESVDAFFKTEQEIIKQQALAIQYHRELQGLINPLNSQVKIYSKEVTPHDQYNLEKR